MFVAASGRDDPAHRESIAFLRSVVRSESAVHEPALALVEICAAIARRTHDRDLAGVAGRRLLQMPGLVLHPLDLEAAARAAALAGTALVRGADAVYLATALSAEAVLVTLDHEMLARGASVLAVMTPAEWLVRRA